MQKNYTFEILGLKMAWEILIWDRVPTRRIALHTALHTQTPVTELIAGLRSAAAAAAVTVLQKVTFEANPKVRNHGEGPY